MRGNSKQLLIFILVGAVLVSSCAGGNYAQTREPQEVGCGTLSFTVINRLLRSKCSVVVHSDPNGQARIETMAAGSGDELLLFIARAQAERGKLPPLDLRSELDGFLALMPGAPVVEWGPEHIFDGYSVHMVELAMDGETNKVILFGRNERPIADGYADSVSGLYFLKNAVSNLDVASSLLKDIKYQ